MALLESPYNIEWLDVDQIMHDRETAVGHQRAINMSRAQQIAKRMRPDAMETPVISRRADGVLWPVGGQHRVKACQLRGLTLVRCRVYDGLSLNQERELWVILNTATAGKGLPLYHGMIGFDPDVTEIDRIVHACGYYVPQSYGGKGKSAIRSVTALRWIYQFGGSAGLSDTLLTLSKAWPSEPLAVGEGMLRGMFIFLRAHGERVNREKLLAALTRSSVDAVLRSASRYADNYRGRNYTPVAFAINEVYNAHVRKLADKLDPVAINHYSAITGPEKAQAKAAAAK